MRAPAAGSSVWTAVGGKLRNFSFRARLGTVSALAVGLTVAIGSLAAYFTVHHQLYSQTQSQLESVATSAINDAPDFNPNNTARFLRRINNSLLQVIDAQGSVPYFSGQGTGSPNLPVSKAQIALAQSGQHQYAITTVTYEGSPYLVITEGGFTDVSTGQPAAVEIARPLTDIEHTLGDLRLILWLVTLGGVALGVALGWLIGKTAMRPVVRLTGAAEHVAATQDLSATIDEHGDDELTRLARSFNSMLRALAASRQQQSQLISDAGHELRTPLTSLRTNIEVLMKVRDLPEEDRSELIFDVNAQLEEMTTLIGDLVELARSDERQQAEPIEVRLDSLVRHAVDRAQRRAAGVTFDTHLTPGSVRAQPALLERAVMNILDNAAKWSPAGGTVSVWLQRGACWTLDVHDHGPGIPADDLPHVFERFYRAASSRSMPGSGLGLAIVRQVVHDHGGSVTATCPPEGGTLIHIELPIVNEQEPTPLSEPSTEPEMLPAGDPTESAVASPH